MEKWYTSAEIIKMFPHLSKQRLHQLRESYSSIRHMSKVISDDSRRLILGVDFIRIDYKQTLYSQSAVAKIKKRTYAKTLKERRVRLRRNSAEAQQRLCDRKGHGKQNVCNS